MLNGKVSEGVRIEVITVKVKRGHENDEERREVQRIRV